MLFWAMAAGKVHLVQGRYYGQELGELTDCGHVQLVRASCTLPIEICGAGGHQEGSCYYVRLMDTSLSGIVLEEVCRYKEVVAAS